MAADNKSYHPRIRLPADAYADPERLYLITICTESRKPWFANAPMANDAVATLLWTRKVRHASVYAFCVMPDHVHVLHQPTAGDNVAKIVSTFKSASAKRFTKGAIPNQPLRQPTEGLWQSRFHDRALRKGDSGIAAVEYVLDNPVRKKLVAKREEYEFSGTPDILDSSYG